MKVLLTKDVAGLGRSGDVKDVSEGHARNYLIPRHLALPATTTVLAKIQKEEAEHQAKVAKEVKFTEDLKARLENKTFIIHGKADKQHLFAAIKPAEIASAINSKLNLKLEPNQIILEKPIKSLGLHQVLVRLAQSTQAKVKLTVEAN